MSIHREIHDALLEQGLLLRRVEQGIRGDVSRIIDGLRSELGQRVRFSPPSRPITLRGRRAAAERALSALNPMITAANLRATTVMRRAMRETIEAHAVSVVDLLNDAIGGQRIRGLSRRQVRALTEADALIGGAPLREWTGMLRDAMHRDTAAIIRTGALRGDSTGQLNRALRDAMIAKGQRGSVMIARTAFTYAQNSVMEAVIQRNSSLIRARAASAVLDGNTSQLCNGRHGGLWRADDGRPLPESPVQIQFPGIPPWHPNCRTLILPVLNGQRVKGDLGALPIERLDAALRRRGASWGRQQLGARRYELWEAGKMTTAQLADQAGRAATLDQIARSRKSRRPSVARA